MTRDDAGLRKATEVHGQSFLDSTTGLRYAVLHPDRHSRLWATYIEQALARYAEFGVDHVIDAEVRTGEGVDLFWMAFDDDRPIAGARALVVRKLEGLRALDQMAGHGRLHEMSELLAAKIADGGLIEGGTAWRVQDAPRGTSSVLARCCLASTFVLGQRWCVGTAGAPGLQMWTEAGCEPVDYGTGSPWPAPEHETRLLLFDSQTLSPSLERDYHTILSALTDGEPKRLPTRSMK